MDEVVFQRFVDGDDAAFTFIYNKYVDLLLQYGRSLGFEKEVLKDAIQDVFVKLYLNRRNLSEVRNLKYYLFRSLKNNLLDMLKVLKDANLDIPVRETFGGFSIDKEKMSECPRIVIK